MSKQSDGFEVVRAYDSAVHGLSNVELFGDTIQMHGRRILGTFLNWDKDTATGYSPIPYIWNPLTAAWVAMKEYTSYTTPDLEALLFNPGSNADLAGYIPWYVQDGTQRILNDYYIPSAFRVGIDGVGTIGSAVLTMHVAIGY
jgi:hypothetical protein